MNPNDFTTQAPGKLVPITVPYRKSPDPSAALAQCRTIAFIPHPLPPALDWKRLKVEQFDRYQETIAALNRLNGLHKRVGNAATLLRTLWMREAQLSSAIEDVDTTGFDLVLAGAGRQLEVRQHGLESWNYVRALEHGVHSNLPMSQRLIREMHNILLENVEDARGKRPGQFRDTPVYIGDRIRGPEHARFVPVPPGDALMQTLNDLEKYIHGDANNIPALFAIALMHYQFETIHPFRDGNGRIGRVMISRSLVKEKLLDHPVVYMSAYIKDHKRTYTDLLLAINREGGEAWYEWIEFMLEAIRTQALDSVWRSEHLIQLRENYHQRITSRELPTRLLQVIDRLFASPAINAKELAELVNVSLVTARKDIASLEDVKILEEYTGKERDRDYVARDIIKVIEANSPSDLALDLTIT